MPPFEEDTTIEDNIMILDDLPADHSIREVEARVTAKIKTADAPALPIPVIPEPPKEHLLNGEKVYCEKGYLYTKYEDSANCIARSTYFYPDGRWAWVEAFTTTHGGHSVFCTTAEDLEVFKELSKKINIQIRGEIKAIAFFAVDNINDAMVANCYSDNLAIVLCDGKNIKYGIRYGQFEYMGLESPINQKPEKIFDEIMRFLSLSVKGVREELKQVNKDLLEVAERGTEDLYFYLQDIPPQPGREDFHNRIVERLARAYPEDAMLMASHEKTAAEYAAIIKGAKSQMPQGRRGKPIRDGYLTAPVLSELLDWFTIERNGKTLTLTFVFKNDLSIEGEFEDEDGEPKDSCVEYGRPVVKIKMATDKTRGRDGTYIMSAGGVQGSSQDLKAFLHPHLDGNRNWCLGTYITPINHAIISGNIPLAASLIWQYLNSYNPSSPLVALHACEETMASARKRDLIIRRI